jgi:hypothetical protein
MQQLSSAKSDVVVSLRLLERTPNQLKFQIKVSNSGARPVLIVTDPVRLDGSKGVYLSLNEKDPTLLELGLEVFPPPPYTRLAPKNRVTFKQLEAGGTYEEEVVVQVPLEETKPPWGNMPDAQTIDITKVRQVRVNVGVLPDEPEVREAFANDPSPEGMEVIKSGPLKGESLFEIQEIVSSEKVPL